MSFAARKFALFLVFMAAAATPLAAQAVGDGLSATASAAYSYGLLKWLSSFLSADQLAEFEKALYPALQQNPALVQEGIGLAKEGQTKASDLAPADREAYLQKLRDYETRLRQAMMKQDPDVGKIFDLIDAHIAAISHT